VKRTHNRRPHQQAQQQRRLEDPGAGHGDRRPAVADQRRRGGFRALHRQRGKTGEAVGPLAHFGGQRIVGLARHRDRLFDVVDRLHRGRIQR